MEAAAAGLLKAVCFMRNIRRRDASTSLYVRAARYCADMYFCLSEAGAQLMGETLTVSSFAKLFCDQFGRLCLCSLPLYLPPPSCVKWMQMRAAG